MGYFSSFAAPARRRLWYASLVLSTSACSRSPSQDLLGSYFPGWLLCALGGIIGASLVKGGLSRAGVDTELPFKLPVYGALSVAMSFCLWLSLYGN